MRPPLGLFLLLGFLVVGGSSLGLRSKRQPSSSGGIEPSGPPGFNPVDLLCRFRGREQRWCKDWLTCLNTNSRPPTIESVRKAWRPADCKEICGVYPQVTPTEGEASKLLELTSHRKAAAVLFGLKESTATRNECVKSCENFQESLSTCVGTVLFEPGKLATMGGEKEEGPEPAEVCTKRDTPCLPDLPERRQKCIGLKGKAVVAGKDWAAGDGCWGKDTPSCECERLEFDWDDCKDCPQMRPGSGSEYTAFVGGCLDQMNAYYQATHPQAGATALPGATGCTVH